jgi:hypothetical protein
MAIKKKNLLWIGDIVKLPCGILGVINADSNNGQVCSISYLEKDDDFKYRSCYNSWYRGETAEDTLVLVERGPASKYREKLFGGAKSK